MICLPDCPQFFASYFGAMKIGAVPEPVSTTALPQDYRYYLNHSGANALLTHQDLAPNIKRVHSELHYLRHFIVVGEAEPGELHYDSLLTGAALDFSLLL